ncbi:fused MFS/spermidine synthase [Spirochaetota bacterium]
MNGQTKVNKENGKTGINWIMLIYFASGLCSLIDEVVWVRLIKLTLGNTVYASTIVVSMFMGGLALGSLIMGRYADRIKRRLRLYAILEILITISALSLPFALKLMDKLYKWFYVSYQPNPNSLLVLQVLISAVILLIPAMLMGSTLPLLSRFVTTLEEKAGNMVGKLYALNTFGATLGCFLAGFVLIRLAGVMGTLYIAAGVNLLVAISGWILSLSHDKVDETPKAKPDLKHTELATTKDVNIKKYLLLIAVFTSGFISIGYELIWMRSISYQLNSFTYVFSAVLTVYLLGNVFGAWIGSRLSKHLTNPSIWFGASLTLLGLLGILFIPWITAWYKFMPSEAKMVFKGFWMIPVFRIVIIPILHSLSLFLLPSIVMGIGFPLAIQAWNNYRHKTGLTTGTIYGTNTIGAVLGGIATGFLLIPLFGSQLSITMLGFGGICTGTLIFFVFDKKNILFRRIASISMAALFLITGILLPSDLMNRSLIKNSFSDTIEIKESVTTTSSVRELFTEGKRYFLLGTSNQIIGSDWIHRSAQKTLGHLGIFLNEQSKNVLSIGFGTGETTACLSKHNLKRIDCVEIAPELVTMAIKYFKHINLGNKLNQKVNMIYMDAKNYLHLTNKKYDIIINGANLPYESGSAPLFTKEHFKNALDRLNENGLFITKFHLNTSKSVFHSTLGTFMEVFPHATIWFPTTRPIPNFYLVGSLKKQFFSPMYIDKELKNGTVKKSTSYLFYRSSIDILSGYIGDKNDLKNYLKGNIINSDYSPFIEFNFEKKENLQNTKFFIDFLIKVRRGSLVSHLNWSGMSQKNKSNWLKAFWQSYNSLLHLIKAKYKHNPFERLDINYKGLKNMPYHPALLHQQELILKEIEKLFMFGKIRGNKYGLIANNKLQKHMKTDPLHGPIWLIKSWAHKQQGQLDMAIDAGKNAVLFYPFSPMARQNLGELYIKTGESKKAILQFKEALKLNPNSPVLHYYIGEVLLKQGFLNGAIDSYKKALSLNPRFKNAKNRLDRLLKY